MSKLKRFVMVNGLGAGLLALSAGFADASPVTSPATVYSGPGLTWPVIAEIPAGADVNVLNCYAGWEQGWCQVRYHKVTGFVEGGVLAPSGAENVIVAPVVTRDLANVRKGPGTNWPIVGVLVPGSEVNLGRCVQGWLSGWCRVQLGDVSGWVHGSLLKRKGTIFD